MGMWEKFNVFSHGFSNSRCALIAFREGPNCAILFSHLDDNVKYVILIVEIQSLPFILINYYAPNEEGQQVQLLTKIRNFLEKMELQEDTPSIWGGDFNSLIDCKLMLMAEIQNCRYSPLQN